MLAASGHGVKLIAHRLETSPATVRKWVRRFEEHGIDGILHDRVRRGRPRTVTPEIRAKVVHDTLCSLPPTGSRWTVRSMAKHQGLPPATIHRIWEEHGIDPRRLPQPNATPSVPDIPTLRAAARNRPSKPHVVGRHDVERVVIRVRPSGIPAELKPGYRIFEGLLRELFVRGSRDIERDVETMLHELDDDATLTCARHTIVEWEVGRVVGTVAYAGPGSIDPSDDNLRALWPPMLPHQRMPVLALAMLVQNGLTKLAKDRSARGRKLRTMLADTRKAWPVEQEKPARSRGRPTDEKKHGVYVMGARERLFDEHAKVRWFVDVVDDITKALAVANGTASRAVKAARALWPVPAGWKRTLLARRLAPLHTQFFTTLNTPGKSVVPAPSRKVALVIFPTIDRSLLAGYSCVAARNPQQHAEESLSTETRLRGTGRGATDIEHAELRHGR